MRSPATLPRQIVELYRNEILEEAAKLCVAALPDSRKLPQALHVCGLITRKRGAPAPAIALLLSAIRLNPREVQYLSDAGDALAQAGRHAEAIGACLRALALRPDDPELFRALGRALLRGRQPVAARAILDFAVRLDPHHAATYLDLADTWLALGRTAEALEGYQQSLGLDSRNADGFARMGKVYTTVREWHLAAGCFRDGLLLQQNRADLHRGLAQALFHTGDLEHAAVEYRAAVALGDMTSCIPLVGVLQTLGQRDDLVGVWCWYASALSNANRDEEASVAYKQALAVKPDCLRALAGLGSLHLRLREPQKAKDAFRAAIALQPDYRWGHICLGQAHHMCGELREGWQELAWYNREKNVDKFEQPMWNGQPLAGKTILLWADWYLGDTIQLVRYARHVKALGGRVIVQCDPILVSLFERSADVDRVVGVKTPLPHFDVHAPFGELPRILGTSLTTIPAEVPYLTADPAQQDRWRERLGEHNDLRVGLVWSGDPTRNNASVRFTTLATLEPLAGASHARFFSLQLGPPTAELLAPPRGLQIDAPLAQSASIDETAGLMMNLDLVMTVDTMAAHLASALGIPVWLLAPYAPDWRWHAQGGDRSPWYPLMRVFTQEKRGDWTALLKRVRLALDVHIANGSVLEPRHAFAADSDRERPLRSDPSGDVFASTR